MFNHGSHWPEKSENVWKGQDVRGKSKFCQQSRKMMCHPYCMRTIVTHFLLSFCQHLYNVEYNYRSQINGDGKGWYGEEEATVSYLKTHLLHLRRESGKYCRTWLRKRWQFRFWNWVGILLSDDVRYSESSQSDFIVKLSYWYSHIMIVMAMMVFTLHCHCVSLPQPKSLFPSTFLVC